MKHAGRLKVFCFVFSMPLLAGGGRAEAQSEPPRPAVAATTPAAAARINALLLARPEVQTHLRLSLRQKAALELTPAGKPKLGSLADGSMLEKAIKSGIAMGESPARRQANEDTVRRVLRPEQLERLLQLGLQERGPLALSNPDVAPRVLLTPERRTEIHKIARDTDQANRTILAAFAARPGISGESLWAEWNNRLSPTRRAMDRAKKEAEDKILALLTPDESLRWRKLVGEPFAFRTDRAR